MTMVPSERQKLESLERELAECRETLGQLQDLAIWMTGCGFDFAARPYFREKRYLFTVDVREPIAALAASPQPPVSDGWRDIASAPKDGTEILGLGFPPDHDPNGFAPDVRVIRCSEYGNWSARNHFTWFTVGFVPTHWQPLPAALAPEGK